MRKPSWRTVSASCQVILRSRAGGRKRRDCGTIRRMYKITLLSTFGFLLLCLSAIIWTSDAAAQMPSDFPATTEQSCSFGMAKGEPSHQCQVPVPSGCLVANAPGTNKPWTTVSKGGKTFCRFDEKQTDWKTKITGTCGRCSSGHCSVQFIVRFDCNPR